MPFFLVDNVKSLFDSLETIFRNFVDCFYNLLFYPLWDQIPLIVLWLISAACFFTLRFGFINLRAFKHALDVVWGKYDAPEDEGDISHFQALSAALSSTVGLGNIAGVAIAIRMGGAGVVLWITLAGLLGMSSKFIECTLAQKYRTTKADGTVTGGGMYYLSQGLAQLGLPRLGKGLGISFAILCALGSLGMGNMFQANQSWAGITTILPTIAHWHWLYGVSLAVLVGIVIWGGIRRIGAVLGVLMPGMAVIYILAASWVIGSHLGELPGAITLIFRTAFSPEAIIGGGLGVLAIGFQRAALSNEAGLGSAAIAHAAAQTDEPVREGIVALLEPFIDTVVICNLTALVIILTSAYQDGIGASLNGIALTANAFAQEISWFPYLIALAGFLFAFSTMISWSYYGQQAWGYLFGEEAVGIYQVIFLCCIVFGSVIQLGSVLHFSDLVGLAMSFPNLIGCYLLSGIVATDLKDYMQRLQSGKMLPPLPKPTAPPTVQSSVES